MTIIGIDLGTTNSVASVWQNGQAVLIPNRLGAYLTPSVVSLDEDGALIVGEVAKARLRSHPARTAAVFKRDMGGQKQYQLGEQKLTAPELSALVLKSLKEDAQTFLGEPITEAVISVPAYFNDAQRKATALAAQLVDLKVIRLVNEPTAAAMAYGLHDNEDGARYAVLDLGGGTFDVSVVEYFSGVIEVHSSAGDNFLGGEDFLDALVKAYCMAHGIDLATLNAHDKQNLYAQLENVKKTLSHEFAVIVPPLLPEQTSDWRITRDDFANWVKPLLNRMVMPIERALKDARLAPAEIDKVILVGGASRMAHVKALASRLFQKLPIASLDPDLVVAIGAAVQAGLAAQDAALNDVVLTDVCPYSLGTGIHNPNSNEDGMQLFSPIIERNQVVPISRVEQYCTVVDNQTQLNLTIYQGESRFVKNNIKLGEIKVNIPARKAGEETVDMRFSYDMNGLLEVDVKVNSTGQVLQKTIVNSAGALSDDEIAASHAKLAQLKFHPRDSEDVRLLLSRAENAYQNALGDERHTISRRMQIFEGSLNTQDLKKIERSKKEFAEYVAAWEANDFFERESDD
ncbi:MAG: Hsp70 family protein [Formosimonas sp.]